MRNLIIKNPSRTRGRRWACRQCIPNRRWRGARRWPTLWLSLLLLAGFAPAAADAAPPYRLGHGYRLSGLPLTVGGYASLKFLDPSGPERRLEVSDLSLFLSLDGGGRWRAFSELEVGEALVVEDGRASSGEAEFELERLYLEYRHRNALQLRLGKFLTPIGHWNQVHADPLVWTVTRPLTTDTGFAHHATGLMLHGNLSAPRGLWGYQLYLDDTRDLDPRPETRRHIAGESHDVELGAFHQGQGLRWRYLPDSGDWQVGLSLASFQIEGFTGTKRLAGLDFLWHPGSGLRLSGEAIYRTDSEDEGADEWGAFLQAVLPLGRRWYAVGRLEGFDDTEVPGVARTVSLTLSWRPVPTSAVKFELLRGKDNDALAPDGFFASIAVLF